MIIDVRFRPEADVLLSFTKPPGIPLVVVCDALNTLVKLGVYLNLHAVTPPLRPAQRKGQFALMGRPLPRCPHGAEAEKPAMWPT